MKKSIVILLISFSFIGYYCYNNFFTKDALLGVYLNRNFNYRGTLTEIPYKADTLMLFEDNHFTSSYWGKGTYKMTYSIFGTKIVLIYNYQFGKAGYKTEVTRLYGISPKIILNKEKKHYLEKINNDALTRD